MFRVIICCAILGLFSVRGSVPSPECPSGACDDRPVCPRSPCSCLYPSRSDCALYYRCEQGEPHQHRCSPGLWFNRDTLTCDYESNVNCSNDTTGKTTRETESSTRVTATVATTEVTESPGFNDTTSDHSSRSTEQSNNPPENNSTEIFSTTVSNTYKSTDTIASESSHLPTGTAETTLTDTQTESPSKYTNKVNATTPGLSSKTTPDFSTNSISDITLETIYSKSSSFVSETTSSTSMTKQSEIPEIPKSTLTTQGNESSEKESTVTVSKEKETPETTKSIFGTKESEEPETTNPSTTQKIEIWGTTTTSTAREPEITNPSSTTEQNEELETTQTALATKESEGPETVSPSTTKKIEIIETTTSISKESETTILSSTTKQSKETETSNPSFTTKEIETSPRSTTTETASGNRSSGFTDRFITSTEVTTSIISRKWTCPSRFGLFPDESDCHKFYHCSHWTPHHKRCPADLHFNAELKVCDWPENAGCDRLFTSATTHSDPTKKISEISSTSSTTAATVPTDYASKSTSSRIETANDLSELKDLIRETTFVTKATDESILTDESNVTFPEINSTLSFTTYAPTTDDRITSENKSTNDELFSTQHSESTSEEQSAEWGKNSSTSISTTLNNTTVTESTVTVAISSKATSDETSAKLEMTPTSSEQPSTGTNSFSNISTDPSSATEHSAETEIISLPTTVQDKISPRSTILEKEDIKTMSSFPAVSNQTELFSARVSTMFVTKPFSVTEISSEELDNSSVTIHNKKTTPEIPSSENTESEMDEKPHSIVPDVTTKKSPDNEALKFECPTRFGFYPDPLTCSKFYECSQWMAQHRACPSNLHFNPTLQACDWPFKAGCEIFFET